MTYELAKQLKDAGFPQNLKDRVSHYSQIEGHDGPELFFGRMFDPQIEVECQVPTLSELIEACREDFFSLERHNNSIDGVVWHVNPATEDSQGTTAEEAVVMFWLALNKK